MARIKFSAVGITEILGKAGGTVFSKNKGGAYFKNFVVPSNPRTEAQSIVRAAFGAISQAWRGLTGIQRASWNSKAPSFPYQNVFGDSKILSGFGLHQQLNLNLENSGQPAIADAPAKQTLYAPIDVVSSELNTTLGSSSIAYLFFAAQPTAGVMVLEITPPQSAGVKNFSGKYRKVATLPIAALADEAVFPSIPTYEAIIDVIGVPPAGSNMGLRAKFVGSNGETTTYLEGTILVE